MYIIYIIYKYYYDVVWDRPVTKCHGKHGPNLEIPPTLLSIIQSSALEKKI